MIFFQVSLNFDAVKEILKIRCQIYILMKKVIILSKMQVKWIFLLYHYSVIAVWAWTEKKKCGNDSREKVTTETQKLNMFLLQLPIYYLLE